MSGPSVTNVQKWALAYLMVEEQNERVAEADQQFRADALINNREIYEQIIQSESDPEMITTLGGDHDEGYSMDDTDEIERFLRSLPGTRISSAADDDDEGGWL